MVQHSTSDKPSNYDLYQQAAFNQPAYYPLHPSVPSTLYHPIATWMGRLILPSMEQRQVVKGVLMEVHHAPAPHQDLVGQIVNLRWSNTPQLQARLQAVRQDIHFSHQAQTSQRQGNIHPLRLDRWQQVDPLESLAGARPNDDLVVRLRDPVRLEAANSTDLRPTLSIEWEPVQITGRFYALVRILRPASEGGDQFHVVHFDRTSRQFNGAEEIVRIPQVIANKHGVFPSTSRAIEQSPPNPIGWYIYGAWNRREMFVVQAIVPHALLRLQPDEVISGQKAAFYYIKKQSWHEPATQKGQISSVFLNPQKQALHQAINYWQEGDRALVLHVYGGIGGQKKEPAAMAGPYFGHFAFGIAQVVRDPLSNELRFEIAYHQIYTQNTDGIVAGAQAWCRYMGDRQWGWLGTRPTSDIVIKLDVLEQPFVVDGVKYSVLDMVTCQLETMAARYRSGDGTGATFAGPANNCAQDSNQALYATLKQLERALQTETDGRQKRQLRDREARAFKQLAALSQSLKQELMPLGKARPDWEKKQPNLGIRLDARPFTQLRRGIESWRTMLPRFASDTLARIFLEQGASMWVLRTNQVGGNDPEIAPIAPMTL